MNGTRFLSLQNLIPLPLPFSGLGLLYIASPPLSLHCISFFQFLMPSILRFSSTSSLYLRLGLPTGLSPANIWYSVFLVMRLLSMRSVCPAYCNRFNLSPPDMHGLSCNLCNLLLLFFICRFLLLVAIFVSIFFNQIS